jgi:hypothetical protein
VWAGYGPPGQPVSRPQEGRDALEQARRQPAGGASDDARRQGGQPTPPRAVHDQTRDPSVRPRFKTTRPVARPRHTQTP